MFLKNYQIKVVGELKRFFQTAREEWDFCNSLPPETEKAVFRNRFVAAIAASIFIPYTEPKGKTERFCNEISNWDK